MVQPVGSQIYGAFLQGQDEKRRQDAQGIRTLAGALGIRGALMDQKLQQQMAPLQRQALEARIAASNRLSPIPVTGGYLSPDSAGKYSFQQTGQPKAEKVSSLGQLLAERDALPQNDPRRAIYNAAIDKAKNPAPGVTVKLPPGQKPFWDNLAGEEAKGVYKEKEGAKDAAAMISTINTGRELLDSGVITGFGADFLTSAGQALKRVGIQYNNDAIANTQAYVSALAVNVGKVIKQFGSGTGLSDADREYAQKIVGGSVNLDEGALRRILDINEKAARNLIKNYNKKAAQIQSSPNAQFFPYALTVDEPPAYVKKGGKSTAPAEVDQKVWDAMTPEQKKLWQR